MCHLKFPDAQALTAHHQKHKTAEKYQCVECNKIFTKKQSLVVHVQLHVCIVFMVLIAPSMLALLLLVNIFPTTDFVLVFLFNSD